MQGISIFQQIYAPRVAHVVTGFDGVSHNTHSPYAIGGVVGSVGKMTAIVANDQADTWHIVNLKCGKIFDAVAVLGAFDESEAANMAMRYHGQYFDAVCGDVCESNTGGLQRFLNHPVYMRTNRPVYAEELAKLQDIPSTQAILWDGVQLKSHNGSSKHLLLDMMRCDDDKALLEKMDFVEEESKLDGEIAEYDALVVEAYKLEGTVSKLALAMDKATSISTLKVANQTLSKPKTMRGFGVIQQLVSFELSDGQAVSIIFNVSDSEANASAKMTKDDLLVAWKYKLNSRDITAAVQPNATQNVSLNMIASRIMGLADANSEKFVAAQKKKDAMQTELANTNQQVKDLQGQEQALLQEIADLQKQLDEKAKNKALQEAESRAEVEGMPKDVQSAPQDRPTDYRTNLESARAVAKSLGIETKGKKLSRLLREIDIFDEKEVKKELLSEFKALASRLVLPKGYVFDLSDAEKSIDDITRWVSPIIKQKGAFDFNKIRIELRAVTSINEYEGGVYISDYVFFYTEDKKAKAELDKLNYPNDGNINASEPKTPKATVEKMEQFLIKAVFPKIEYLKVLNSTNVDVSKLSEIGIAEITDIGNENLYFEKDGKYYISKVGNPQLYALGEWDFAKYPDGVVSQATEPKQPERKTPKSGDVKQDVFNITKGGMYGLDLYATNKDNDIKVFLPRGFNKGLFNGMTVKATVIYQTGRWGVQSVDEIISDPLKPQRDAQKIKDEQDYKEAKKKEIAKDADAYLYEMDAKGIDSITLKDGVNSATFTRDEVMDVINERRKALESEQPVIEPPMTNPDRDYLQSIIEGDVDLSNADEIEAKLTDINERLDADLEPLFEQAAEVFAQYGIAQAAMN